LKQKLSTIQGWLMNIFREHNMPKSGSSVSHILSKLSLKSPKWKDCIKGKLQRCCHKGASTTKYAIYNV
jgi:hypothetical protein